MAGRPRRERVLERLSRAARRRGARRQPRASSTSRRTRSPRSRAPCPACATSIRRSSSTTPRCASTPTARRRAGRRDARAPRRRPRSRRRSATSTRRACGSTPATAQSYYVVTYYDATRRSTIRNALAPLPVRVGRRGARGHARRLRHDPPRRPVRSRSSATSSQRAAHVADADRGARHRQRRRRARAERSHATRAPRDVKFDFVGQVELMRTTFSGLGVAHRPRGHGRLHDHGVAVQVAAPAVHHALHDPGVARRHRARAASPAGQGFSITALMGVLMVVGIAVSNGILLVDDANAPARRGRRRSRSDHRGGALALRARSR